MNIENELLEKTDFSNNEILIADYILAHKDDVLQMSIQSLAKNTYTSTSAVMRLCKRLHMDGFKEFKIRFAQELSSPNINTAIDPNLPFRTNDSVGQIASQLQTLTMQAVQQANKTLSIRDMKHACSLILDANHVAIFGVGDAYLSGLTFQTRMMRSGINFLTTPVYGEQGHLAQTLQHSDCALLLSYSGTTRSTIACAQTLKKNNVKTICITANQTSALTKLCDITLLLPSSESKFHRIASFFSQTTMDYYLNVMYSYLYVLDSQHRKAVD